MLENILQGLRISGIGLLGVFGVLLVFYAIAVILDKIPSRDEEAE